LPTPALDLTFAIGSGHLIDRVAAILDDFELTAIHETGDDAAPRWRVCFPSREIRDRAERTLIEAIGPYTLGVHSTDLPDDDWAARSQATLGAVRVGRVIIAPPWDVPLSLASGQVLVLIRPSMGFGTGHHETTRLCLELLQATDCSGRYVVDIGTGSGVLALAAGALGAARAQGIDVDEDAIANAQDNLALNPSIAQICDMRFEIDDLEASMPEAAADIVLANLTGPLLVRAAPALLARAGDGGVLIVSGFLVHEAEQVLQALALRAEVVRHTSAGEWHAALVRTGSARA
jgi:ribosomal protein L11 methyltransferase